MLPYSQCISKKIKKKITLYDYKGGILMATGKSFNHKRKGHPGAFPKGSENVKPKNNIEEEGYLVWKEAYKNSVSEE